MSLWYVGALLSIAGSVASNLGINVQKYSFIENAKKPREQQRAYTGQPGWALGLALVIGGSIGDFVALALAAQSIIAPIGSVTLVANMVFAQFWLKELLSARDMLGTVLIIGGSVLTVAFGDHSSPEYKLSDFKSFFGQSSCAIYCAVLFVTCCTLYAIIRYLQPLKTKLVEKRKEYCEAPSAAECSILLLKDVEYQNTLRQYSMWSKIHPFAYCCLSGILGAQSVLFGKMVSSLISTTLQGDNQLLSPFPYIFLACMLAAIFSQIHFLALALSFFDALYCVPMFQCFFILVSTVGGAAFFEEFNSFTVLQSIIFPIGIMVTLGGVSILAQRDSHSDVAADFVSGYQGEGAGHRVIPATTATFFFDVEQQIVATRTSLTRSHSHNSLPMHKSRVQLERDDVDAMAEAAAKAASCGEMKLTAEVEASLMREISKNHYSTSAAPASTTSSSSSSAGKENRRQGSAFITASTGKHLGLPSGPAPTASSLHRLHAARVAPAPIVVVNSAHHQRAGSSQVATTQAIKLAARLAQQSSATPSRNSAVSPQDEDSTIEHNSASVSQFYTQRKMKSRSVPTHWPRSTSSQTPATQPDTATAIVSPEQHTKSLTSEAKPTARTIIALGHLGRSQSDHIASASQAHATRSSREEEGSEEGPLIGGEVNSFAPTLPCHQEE